MRDKGKWHRVIAACDMGPGERQKLDERIAFAGKRKIVNYCEGGTMHKNNWPGDWECEVYDKYKING